jgi:hypothetical protein
MHVLLTVVPYVSILVAFVVASSRRAAEIRDAAPPDAATATLQASCAAAPALGPACRSRGEARPSARRVGPGAT